MKSLLSFSIFSAHVICSALGLIFLKKAFTDTKISLDSIFQIALGYKFITGMALYVTGFLIWLYILSKYDLNFALPIAQSLFFVLTIGASFFFLKEPLNFQHVMGIVLCLAGIIVISVK